MADGINPCYPAKNSVQSNILGPILRIGIGRLWRHTYIIVYSVSGVTNITAVHLEKHERLVRFTKRACVADVDLCGLAVDTRRAVCTIVMGMSSNISSTILFKEDPKGIPVIRVQVQTITHMAVCWVGRFMANYKNREFSRC